MDDEHEPSWKDTALRVVAHAGSDVLFMPIAGVPGITTSVGIVLEHIIRKRRHTGEKFIETVVSHVGEHELLTAIQTDDERNELLWSSVQASMSTGIEGKRIYLARVVANAMTDATKIDGAQLIVKALTELEGPHVRALVELVAADDANQAEPGNSDEILQAALEAIPAPVLATLVRVGVVYVGSEQRGNGLYSVPRARTYSITGVNDFGRELVDDLHSVEFD
jgi:hypothetical protein